MGTKKSPRSGNIFRHEREKKEDSREKKQRKSCSDRSKTAETAAQRVSACSQDQFQFLWVFFPVCDLNPSRLLGIPLNLRVNLDKYSELE